MQSDQTRDSPRQALSTGQQGSPISELTRRDIFDFIRVNRVVWSGRLSELEFLDRLYRLDDLPSTDTRVSTARADIAIHCEGFPGDWPDDWVLTDKRFGLESGPDEVLLAFLAEMLHPAVRSYEEALPILRGFNSYLAPDGWEVSERDRISGRPVFGPRRLMAGASQALETARSATAILGSAYVYQQITRMDAAVSEDPELAIGTAKEFVETICKTILDARGGTYGPDDGAARLAKLTLKALQLTTDGLSAERAAVNAIRRVVGGLGSIAQGLAELRNLQGTGHGKSAWQERAEPRHARLAVAVGSALGVFLCDTHMAQAGGPPAPSVESDAAEARP